MAKTAFGPEKPVEKAPEIYAEITKHQKDQYAATTSRLLDMISANLKSPERMSFVLETVRTEAQKDGTKALMLTENILHFTLQVERKHGEGTITKELGGEWRSGVEEICKWRVGSEIYDVKRDPPLLFAPKGRSEVKSFSVPYVIDELGNAGICMLLQSFNDPVEATFAAWNAVRVNKKLPTTVSSGERALFLDRVASLRYAQGVRERDDVTKEQMIWCVAESLKKNQDVKMAENLIDVFNRLSYDESFRGVRRFREKPELEGLAPKKLLEELTKVD